MKNYRYLPDAFWEEDARTKLKCIRITELPDGKKKKDVLSLDKLNADGTENIIYKEAVESITVKVIDEYTAQRKERKEREHKDQQTRKRMEDESKKLGDLFHIKLRAMEIESVKNTENKALRSRIRRAQNEIEVTAVVSLIIGEELGMFKND